MNPSKSYQGFIILLVMAQAALLVVFAMCKIVSIHSSGGWFSGGSIEACRCVYVSDEVWKHQFYEYLVM